MLNRRVNSFRMIVPDLKEPHSIEDASDANVTWEFGVNKSRWMRIFHAISLLRFGLMDDEPCFAGEGSRWAACWQIFRDDCAVAGWWEFAGHWECLGQHRLGNDFLGAGLASRFLFCRLSAG